MITGTTTSGRPAEEPPRKGSDPDDTMEAAAVDGTAVAEPGDAAGTRAAGETETAGENEPTATAAPEERPAGEADPGGPAAGILRSNRHLIALSVLCALSTVLNCTLSLLRLAHFQVATYDLVIFDQAVRGYSHFSAPTVPLRGVTGGFGMDYIQLADHFSPILAVLAPFYWLHDGPETLLVAQAVLFALAIPFLWKFTRRVLGTPHAYLVSVAYAISWPVAQATAVEFHEVAFVPLLSAIAVERLHAGRRLPGLLAVLGLLLTKEDLGLMVAGLGVWLFFTGQRRLGTGLVFTGVAVFEVVRKFLIPLAGGNPAYYTRYSKLGEDLPQMLWSAVTHPLQFVGMLFDDHSKWDTWGLLVWPALFLCLLSPLVLAALPLILERLLADSDNWWSTGWHYDAFVIMILLMAGVDGAARLIRWLERRGVPRPGHGLRLAYAAAVFAVAVTTVPYRPFDNLMNPDFYHPDPRTQAREQAISMVPEGVVVEASDDFGARLSGRATVLWWDYQKRGTPWIVASVNNDLRGVVNSYLTEGYELRLDREDIVVLHRIGS
ncbi:DUF2079 domain-containing protein [Microbispora hainanensis]|uniref:DUF2079 domain-containing protein n=1 Tax=Microbispora hainanensis TaxID=568844 RepID=A0A544YYS9_9ACTN|nr:DUF2079 domain-containing protein [Microbispora hainanensis]TQS21875.1 DUF2079 domain-containing protein [Microbispora hainanensis]